MSITFSDFKDSNLAGKASFEAWKTDFEARFIQQDADAMIVQLFSVMTPAQKQMLRAADPQAYDSLVQRLKIQE